MTRKKSYSSELSKIHDTAVLLLQQLKNFEEPVSMLIADSERLHEIEPLLDNLRKVTNVVMPPSTPPPPGTLCNTCSVYDDCAMRDASEYCANYKAITTTAPPEVKAKRKRIKKTLETGKPPEE